MKCNIEEALGKKLLMRHVSKLNRLFLLAIPLFYFGLGTARCSAAPRVGAVSLSSGFLNSGFTIGDFDGDGVLDDVVLVRATPISPSQASYTISIHMGSGVTQEVSITGPLGAFEVLQRDVTGNGTPDLVLAASWQDQPLAVLVNRDNGLGTFRVGDPIDYASSNEIQRIASLGVQIASHLNSVALSSKRNTPQENEGRGKLPLPMPLLGSPFAPDKGDAGRLHLSSFWPGPSPLSLHHLKTPRKCSAHGSVYTATPRTSSSRRATQNLYVPPTHAPLVCELAGIWMREVEYEPRIDPDIG